MPWYREKETDKIGKDKEMERKKVKHNARRERVTKIITKLTKRQINRTITKTTHTKTQVKNIDPQTTTDTLAHETQ